MGRLFMILFLGMFCFYNTSDAQSDVLQVTTNLRPPFSTYIRDYVASSKDAVTVKLKNTSNKTLNIRLGMVLENANGIRLESKQDVKYANYSLAPDKELLLNSLSLAVYFAPENLTFKKISIADYVHKPLPSGVYDVRFNAYDAETGKLITTGVSTKVWLLLNKAPKLLLPNPNDYLYLGENKRFYFEWQPQHDKVAGIPGVEYDFQIVAVPQAFSGSINSIFHTLPVVYERKVTTTSLFIDLAKNPFERGHRYAFRVRARVQSANPKVKFFEDDGYSQISMFIYKGLCVAPMITTIDFPSIHTAEVSWSSSPDMTRYTFLIREAGAKNWDRKDLTQSRLRLSTLDYDKTYEYKVRGYCRSYPGVYSEAYTFMLPSGEKPIMYHSRITLTENVAINYNRADTTIVIADKVLKDTLRVDVREIIKRDVPISIVDDEGNLFTLTPKRLK